MCVRTSAVWTSHCLDPNTSPHTYAASCFQGKCAHKMWHIACIRGSSTRNMSTYTKESITFRNMSGAFKWAAGSLRDCSRCCTATSMRVTINDTAQDRGIGMSKASHDAWTLAISAGCCSKDCITDFMLCGICSNMGALASDKGRVLDGR